MLRNRPHQSPCNGDLPMTPNQFRLRAPSHEDISRLQHLQLVQIHLSTHVASTKSVVPTSKGLGHRALKALAIYPSDRARVSRQIIAIFILFSFCIFFFFSFSFFSSKTHWPSFHMGP